jgi:hypothetical protein
MANLVSTVEAGDRRASLEALRDVLAETIADAEPSNVASLAKQLRETLAELDGLEGGEEDDAVDELAARRPGSSEVPARTARGGKRR